MMKSVVTDVSVGGTVVSVRIVLSVDTVVTMGVPEVMKVGDGVPVSPVEKPVVGVVRVPEVINVFVGVVSVVVPVLDWP